MNKSEILGHILDVIGQLLLYIGSVYFLGRVLMRAFIHEVASYFYRIHKSIKLKEKENGKETENK